MRHLSPFSQMRSWTRGQRMAAGLGVSFFLCMVILILSSPQHSLEPRRHEAKESPKPVLVAQPEVLPQHPPLPMPLKASVLPMRIFRQPYLGFSLRVPENWKLDIEPGRVWVYREAMRTACVLICPIRKASGTLRDLLQSQFEIQKEILKKQFPNLTLEEVKERPEEIEAVLSGSIFGIPVTGKVRAVQRGYSSFYEAIWAPLDEWPSLEMTLESSRDSFESFQSDSLHLFEGQVFQVSYPQGWRVKESRYSIEVTSEDEFNSFLVNFFIYLPGNPTPQEFLKLFDQDPAAVNHVEILSEHEYDEFIDRLGQRWKVIEREVLFDHLSTGRKHGILRGALVSQGNSFSGVMTLRYASIERWDELKTLLFQIENSFRISRPDALGGGTKAVQFPKNLEWPGVESLPTPGTQEDHHGWY
ncbi:MAG: hypothetical protein HYS08_02585 [Chlamydiae bacterium]|nr:hypothetical protein [Chlamydiota bacterium]MBI3266617.1 hypothetical protein [Chlamydiota bacterium]